MRQPFDGLKAIYPVVCGLRWSLPWPGPEDAFHRVKRGLYEIVEVPYLVRVSGHRNPELYAHSETGVLELYLCRGDG